MFTLSSKVLLFLELIGFGAKLLEVIMNAIDFCRQKTTAMANNIKVTCQIISNAIFTFVGINHMIGLLKTLPKKLENTEYETPKEIF